jgi:hypothetical protein
MAANVLQDALGPKDAMRKIASHCFCSNLARHSRSINTFPVYQFRKLRRSNLQA